MALFTASTGRKSHSVIDRRVLLLLFCAFATQIKFSTTAPTQHLTISSAGKIPMIVVTSSDKNFTHRPHPTKTTSSATSVAESNDNHHRLTTSFKPSDESNDNQSWMTSTPSDVLMRNTEDKAETALTHSPNPLLQLTTKQPTDINNTPKPTSYKSPSEKSNKITKTELKKSKIKVSSSRVFKNKEKHTKEVIAKNLAEKTTTEEAPVIESTPVSVMTAEPTAVNTENAYEPQNSTNNTKKNGISPHDTDNFATVETTTEKPDIAMNFTEQFSTTQAPFSRSTSTQNGSFETIQNRSYTSAETDPSPVPFTRPNEAGPPKPVSPKSDEDESGSEGQTEYNKARTEEARAVLSTTVFQVADPQTTTARFPSKSQSQSTPNANLFPVNEGRTPQFYEFGKQTESKISDIQIEVYDSTVDSILSSTNFKESNSDYFRSPLEIGIEGTKAPSPAKQEKFTQYVVDPAEFSTPKSNVGQISPIVPGKPEPAAIEIHINVSEGLENEIEDLEFSYRQSYGDSEGAPRQTHVSSINLNPLDVNYKHNASDVNSNERNAEILVVEIIDIGDNSTENPESFENININPILAFRSETVQKDGDLKDSKYAPETGSSRSHASDDLFMPDVRQEIKASPQATSKPSHPTQNNLVPDHDSDTIFYISNTEVKVGESLPTPSGSVEQQQHLKRVQLEKQFFPANYVTSSRPNTVRMPEQRRYEEDLLLSPVQNTADTIKILRSGGDNPPPPLDVTYVGESIIEVEQSAAAGAVVTTPSRPAFAPSTTANVVVIEPTVLPEIPVGVPIIGELPPQIELKEIDFIPGETNGSDGNVDVDKIIESSMQYGGDLIDEGGVLNGGGFDSVEGSYPFGNPIIALIKDNARNHRINNLKKDDLIADISGSAEAMSIASFLENATLKDGLLRNESADYIGSETDGGEEMGFTGNKSDFAVIESPTTNTDLGDFIDFQTLALELAAVTIPLLIAVYCGKRYFYKRLQTRKNSLDRNDSSNYLANGKNGGGENGLDEPTAWPSQTEHLPSVATTDVIIESVATSKSGPDPSEHKPVLPSHSHPVPNDTSPGNLAGLNAATPEAAPNQSISVLTSCYKGPNGSVTTMTLKNNHLIVETEERNDISRDARETKMHYNSADKDGIFVVEVARGADSKSIPSSPVSRTNKSLLALEAKRLYGPPAVAATAAARSVVNNHEEVQIHQPPLEQRNACGPEELQMELHQIDEVDEPIPSPNSAFTQAQEEEEEEANFRLGRLSTGLSQSDLSSDSSSNSNKRYSYGNQELYTLEKPVHSPLLAAIESTLTAPSAEANDDDHQSENGRNSDQVSTKALAASPNISTGRRSNTGTSKSNEKQEQSKGSTKEAVLMNGDSGAQNQQQQMNKIDQTSLRNTANTATNGAVQKKLASIVMNGNVAETNGNEAAEQIDNNGYDSLVSLPDPPSIEEIKQLNDCNYNIEANQFDSLPPPPPPPPANADPIEGDLQIKATSKREERYVDCSNLLTANRRTPTDNISAAPLTPPASQPLYSSFGNEVPASALAVNVNGS